MSAPTRFVNGVTQAASFQPLGTLGITDPFYYATFEDDFIPYVAGYYTVTASGGSVAASGTLPNGRILFTTAATAASFPEIQLATANFQYVAGKKLAFLCRVQLANVTTQTLVAGLITSGNVDPTTITNGIYFTKAAGSTNLVLNVVNASAVVGTTTITGALTNATDIDLGFVVSPSGSIRAFVGPNLEGVKRQNFTVLGPNAGIQASALTGAIPTTALSPTLAVGNGTTAAAITGNADFLFGAQER